MADFYLLWGADTSRGWRVVKHKVSYAEARLKVEQGKWREVYDAVSCVLLGFQVISTASIRGDRDLHLSDDCGTIRDREMRTWVGCNGRSLTVRLTEDERIVHKNFRTMRLEPEDFIERQQRKVSICPHVGPAVGDILRAWPRAN